LLVLYVKVMSWACVCKRLNPNCGRRGVTTWVGVTVRFVCPLVPASTLTPHHLCPFTLASLAFRTPETAELGTLSPPRCVVWAKFRHS